MKPIPVIACAHSRLHADLMLIRLRRAGVACRKISALFPRRSMPNAVACWLEVDHATEARIGQETIVPAGQIRTGFRPDSDASALIDLLAGTGIDHPSARRLKEKLEHGCILLVVLAATEDEASVVWRVFKHVSAELIVVGQAGAKRSLPAAVADGARLFPLGPPVRPEYFDAGVCDLAVAVGRGLTLHVRSP